MSHKFLKIIVLVFLFSSNMTVLSQATVTPKTEGKTAWYDATK